MRVIKAGNKAEKEKKKTCKKCGTIFSYLKSDVKYDRDGDYVECPKCSAFMATS